MKHSDDLKILFQKFLSGDYTEADLDEILSHVHWDEASPLRELVIQELQKETDENELTDQTRAIVRRLDQRIPEELLKLKETPVKPISRLKVWISVAASIIFLLTAFVFFYKTKNSNYTAGVIKNQQNDIKPGKNKAILTLANGQKIVLSDAANGKLAQRGNVLISKINGQVVYTVKDQSGNSGSALEFNTAETPRGCQYQLNLADGTKIWLNAGSSIKFPTKFIGTERKIELTGEAYFEVAKNKLMPFKVKTAGQEVEVLGTHFNINAYPDEIVTRTTLLEGSVKVTDKNDQQILKPGQQSVLAQNGLRVKDVDTEEAVAWKNGYFRFKDEKIEPIMRKIAYWYDVEVIYSGEVSTEEYNGTISKYKNISQVLNMLSATETVHFKVEGRRITVMK